jgi:hypothetical protein
VKVRKDLASGPIREQSLSEIMQTQRELFHFHDKILLRSPSSHITLCASVSSSIQILTSILPIYNFSYHRRPTTIPLSTPGIMAQMTTQNSAVPSLPNDQDKNSSAEDRRQESMTGHHFAINTGDFDQTPHDSNIDSFVDNVFMIQHRSSETSSQGFSMSQAGTTFGAPRGTSVPSFTAPPPDRESHGALAMATLQSSKRRPLSKKVYLNGFPSYAYIMPTGPALNFTMVDIIVILPNWFSNQQIMDRFMNNGLTPVVHVAILQEHRAMDNMSSDEIAKLREGCSDEYRRVMRTMNPSWKRVSHTVPASWDSQNIAVNHFLPDVARSPRYSAPKPISFKDLMVGIKKLPEGEDAGDLTRALNFALRNQKTDTDGLEVDYMFPDDIHAIINHIGPTLLTDDHSDTVIRFRYDKKQKDAAAANRKRERETESSALQPRLTKRQQRDDSQTPERSFMSAWMSNEINASYSSRGRAQTQRTPPPQALPPSTFGYQTANMPHAPSALSFSSLPLPALLNSQRESPDSWFIQGQDAAPALGYHHHHLPETAVSFDVPAIIVTPAQAISAPVAHANNDVIDLTNYGFPDLPACTRMPPDVEISIAAARKSIQAEGAEDDVFGLNDIDASMAENQFLIPEGYDMGALFDYADRIERAEQPLCTCAEADDPFDFSQLASAARWCRDPDNYASGYTVSDLEFVTTMQAVAARLDDQRGGLGGSGGVMGEDGDSI